MDYESELEFTIETARLAGNLLMENFGGQHSPQWTSETKETNFKIAMDKKSDNLIRTAIKQSFPEDDIYSEEAEDVDRGRERKWVFDPIDGTEPYANHTSNNWSVAIALIKDKTPVLGVVYMPQRGELYRAVTGNGAYCNNIPIRVSQESSINKVRMGVDGGKKIDGWFDANSLSILKNRLEPNIAILLGFACASVPLCQVASGFPDSRLPRVGRLEAYLGGALEPWDMAAEVPIIREVGGKVTHLSGKEWQFSKYKQGDPTILAANPVLHQKLIDYLSAEIDLYYTKNGFAIYK